MGSIDGYRMYGYVSIAQQEIARARLGTTGGEDRLALLDSHLDECKTDTSYLKTIRLIGEHDGAAPILEREILRNRSTRQYGLIKSLVRIPGPESTELIRSLYSQPELRNAVAFALGEAPYRSDVNDIHFDYVLKANSYVLLRRACDAASKAGITEGTALLERMREKPQTIIHYTTATRCLRELQGSPFPVELENAVNTLRVSDTSWFKYAQPALDPEEARRILRTSDDADAAIAMCLELAVEDSAGGLLSERSAALEILRGLPRARVELVLEDLSAIVADGPSRSLISSILDRIAEHSTVDAPLLLSSDMHRPE
jgi:hypothetical protein